MKTFVKILSMLVAVIMIVSVGIVGFTAYAAPTDVLGDYDFKVVDNPYKNIQWNNGTLHAFKASTHAHTVRSDGDIELNDTIWEHYSKGYEVLCLTDHGTVNGVDINDAISGVKTGARYENGWSCGWTESQTRCTLYGYQSFVHGNIDEISESDYYDVIKGVERNGRPVALVSEGRGMFNLPLGNEANAMSGNKCHVNTYNVSVFHGASRNVEWPESTVAGAYNDGAFSRINHVGEWTDGNGDPGVYNASWVSDFTLIFQRYCPNRPDYTTDSGSWNTTNVTGQKVKKGVIGIELVNTSDNRTRNDRFYVYDASLKILAPQGINMYGFCEDDSHEDSDVNKNAQYFLVNDGTAWSEEDKAYYGKHYGARNGLDPWVGYTGDITRSMTMGEFYASSVNSKNSYELGDGFVASGAYPSLSYFNVDDSTTDQITLSVSNASKVRLVADGNIIATKNITEKEEATTVTFDLNSFETKINSYVRIYMTGKGGVTYLQPILLSKTERKQSYVQFILPSADTKLAVYDANNVLIDTQYTDNIYTLPAGDYTYTASRSGYLTKTEAFSVSQADVTAGNKTVIEVNLEKDTSISKVYFYAPETIYLASDNKTFKYYVDRENADDGNLIVSSNKATGNVYFHREGASEVNISYSFQEGATGISSCTLGQTSVNDDDWIATEVTSGSLTSAIADNEYVLIAWEAEYKFEGKTYTSYTYSYVYPAPNPSTKTLSAGGFAETQKTFWGGWNHTTMRVVSSVFAYGFHSVATTDNQGYAFAPYSFTGTDVTSSGPSVSGSGYAWVSDSSDGGGSRTVSSVGGTGYIYADVSRINGFEDIPLFTLGMDINDAVECTGKDGDGNYATLDMFSGDESRNFVNLTNLDNLEQYTGHRLYQLDNAVNNNYTYAFNNEESAIYTLTGVAYGSKSGRHDSVTSTIYIQVDKVNKGALRQSYNTEVSNSYQEDWFNNTEDYIAYRDSVIAAGKVLGDPAATADEIEEATGNLNDAKDSVQLRSGTAQVKHYWRYNNQVGEIQREEPYTYTISEALVANSTEIEGYTYSGMYDRLVDDTEIINDGRATFEKITAVEDNYVWIFYYTPNTYDISYNTNTDDYEPEGGSGKFAVYNQDYTLTTKSPTRPGYVFQGWYLDVDPTYTVYSTAETIKYTYKENGQFNAKWSPLEYSVGFDLNGGEFLEGDEPTADELNVVFDEVYQIPMSVPVRTGYNFLGWKVNGGDVYTAGSQFTWNFPANGTLVAQWSNAEYQITYDANAEGATVDKPSDVVHYEMPYGPLATAHRTGYSYQWYTNPGPNFPDNELVTSETIVSIPTNHTLFAKWTPINYTIKYNLDGGVVEGVNVTNYTIESETFDVINPTRTGYIFEGWSGTDIDVTSYADSITIEKGSHGNREYTAHWKAIIYTITYNLNTPAASPYEVDNSMNPTSFTFADNVVINAPTLLGYNFGGWTGEDYVGAQKIEIAAGTVACAKDLIFDASWNIITYTIDYEFNGGSAGANLPREYTVETGLTVSDPIKEGSTFAGWQSRSFDGLKKDLVLPPGTYGNMILTAVWEADEGVIIYELNGGSVNQVNPTVYKSGDSFEIASPQKLGYDFAGWDKFIVAKSLNVHMKPGAITEDDFGTIIFTASWTPIEYGIVYELDGGRYETRVNNNVASYTAETNTFTLTNPVKEGYIFAGWIGTGLTNPSKAVTIEKGSIGQRTYTAQWNVANYTISYDFAGGASTNSCISAYTYATEDKEIGAPVRAGYSFAGWTQTFQNFTWKPGKLDADGFYVNDSNYYMSSPILLRSGYTYIMNSNGDFGDIEAHLFDAETRTHTTTRNIGTYPTLTLSQGEKIFVYFVVTDEYLDSAYRDTITITVVDNGDPLKDENKQATVSVPQGSTGNFKLTASWVLETYNLSYDLKGGYYNQYDADGNILEEGDEGYVADYNPNPTTFNVESQDIVIENPVKDGYTFLGWKYNDVVFPKVIIKQGSTDSREYTAEWQETVYYINYETNGGIVDGNNPTAYSYSTPDFTLINPTREGYIFGGWTGTDISGVSSSVTVKSGSSGNRAYTATWTPETYNIVYSLGGGVNAASNPTTYTYETATFSLAQPTKAGAVFAGWEGTGLDSAAIVVTIPQGSTGNREYTATWSVSNFTIAYNMAGGENNASNPSFYTVDTPTFTLGIPSRAGYNFIGWTGTGLDKATEYVTIPQGSVGNKNYTANWAPISYNINYILGSGAQVGVANPASYTVESATFTLNNPVRPGFTFTGWSGTEIDTTNGFAQTVTVYKGSTGNRNYTANWNVEEYRITYVLNGGVASNPTTYTITSPDIVLNAPTRTGYKFVAWSGTGITGTGLAERVVIPTGSTGDRTYTAKWEIVKYNIHIDLDGGREPILNPTTYTYLSSTITLHNPVKDGFDFVGWVTSDDVNEVPQPIATIPVNSTGDKYFKAVWAQGRYSLNFELDGGSWSDGYEPETEYMYSSETIVVPAPVKSGYTFAGWSGTGISGTTNNLTIPSGSSGDRSYVANWAEGENIITYDLQGGEVTGDPNPVTYVTDSGTIILNNPVRSGYRFDGWTGTGLTEMTKDVTIDTSKGGQLAFTAHWSAISYTISYVLGGGKLTNGASNPTRYTVESENITLVAPEREGYTFKGWTGTDVDGTQLSVVIQKGSKGARRYTAVWEETVYNIEYDYGEGGSVAVANHSTYTFTTPNFTLNNPTWAGYTFIGWTGSNGTTPQLTVSIEKGTTGNKSYVANYSINTYTLKFLGLNGATFTAPAKTYQAKDVIAIPNPTKLGYTFLGWSGTGIIGMQKDVVITEGSTGNRTYTANFAPVDYTINYELNSGSVSGVNPTSYTIETADFEILNPGRAGFSFDGWQVSIVDFLWYSGTIDASGKVAQGAGYYSMPVSLKAGITYTYDSSVQLAIYKLDGTFVGLVNSGSYTATEDCLCSVVVGALPDAELKAVTLSIDGYIDEVSIARGNMGSITLVATWTTEKFTITYNLGGGALVAGATNPEIYTAESEEFTLNNPSKTGYIFTGWTGTELSKATLDVTVPTGSTGNRIYTANWRIERYYITYNLGGGMFTQTVPEYYTVDTPTFSLPIPIRSHYTFTGWVDEKGNHVSTVTITKGSTGAKSFTAQWEKNSEDDSTHRIYYYGYKNELLGWQDVKVGVVPTGVQPEMVIGYQFTGWSVALDDPSVVNNTEDVHVYSNYTVGPNMYTVTVIVGEETTETQYSQYANVKITAPATNGTDSFLYWRDVTTGAIVSYGSTYSFRAHANITLEAVYGQAQSGDKVTTRITKAEYSEQHQWISFYAERSVASNCEVLQHGIMFTADANIAADSSKFVLGGADVYASTASSTSRSGVYTLSIGGLIDNGNSKAPYRGCQMLYARSYVTYRDASGVTKTVYSDIPAGIEFYVEGINCLPNLAQYPRSI